MLKLGVLVSGGGTNLQAIMDAIDSGVITNAEVGLVISNNPGAYALKRAESRGIPAKCISPKKFENREEFHKALLQELQENKVELVVLAGFLVAIPPMIVEAYPNRIINIHPSLIPSFCGVGFYGLHVHEGVLARGVKVSGATVHFVDEGTDTGPILLQKAVETYWKASMGGILGDCSCTNGYSVNFENCTYNTERGIGNTELPDIE